MFWKIVKLVDRLDYRWNLLRQDDYMRKVAFWFSIGVIPIWILLGWDSGVKIIEDAVIALPRLITNQINLAEWVNYAYQSYGCSFHFSSYTIYGLFFCVVSKHLSKIGIKRSLNLAYSTFLVFFNIGIFEMWYMASFAYFQMNRNILEWFTSDFFYVPVFMNFLFIVLGIFTLLAIATDSVDYHFTWRPKGQMLIMSSLTILSVMLWIYYPFPIQHVDYEGWVSSVYFPQTNYAYKAPDLYVFNFWLHGVNLLVKALFCVSFYMLIRGTQNK